ncbi:MAG: ribosomal protein methyltransferase [Bacteroidota bacterium]|jgi:ribosomal protein L11 methyltransferase
MADGVYLAYTFRLADPETAREVLLAELSELPFDTFEETHDGLIAYVDKRHMQVIELHAERDFPITSGLTEVVELKVDEIQQENWNAKWESSFEPIQIADRIAVRAPFHASCGVDIELIIEPKMSFGTGHHQTTYQMLQGIDDLDLDRKTVLDVGCGTAVLAILAAKKGAVEVEAFDCDDWCVDNSIENAQRNSVSLKVWQASDFEAIQKQYDVLLANINKNVLMAQVKDYARVLKRQGVILISGFYFEDLEDLKEVFEQHGFTYLSHTLKDNWVCAKFLL